jgi:hypothetical protein
MDDLMTMLVQPRHLKLFYAGQAKNWTLAAFQLNELRAALARIGRTIPTYRNVGVDSAVASIFADKIRAVDASIKAADVEKFAAAYGEMTGACNACHAGMEHPFLVMKIPDAMNYPDQDFRPQRGNWGIFGMRQKIWSRFSVLIVATAQWEARARTFAQSCIAPEGKLAAGDVSLARRSRRKRWTIQAYRPPSRSCRHEAFRACTRSLENSKGA